MKQTKEDMPLKEVPICLPDGSQVKVGMQIFTVNTISPSSYEKDERYFQTHSGSLSSYRVENTVIAVNQNANVRSFTIRSDKGCEHTYTVKNTCLPELYGKETLAIEKQRDFTSQDIKKLERKIKAIKESIESEQRRLTKTKTTIAKLKAAKY